MPPFAPPSPGQALLADYTDTLIALPTELTRAFSELRELDAVLRTAVEGMTKKLSMLTAMVDSDAYTPAERLGMLIEIANEAQHLKMGTEDKIRVSSKACEEIVITRRQTDDLLRKIAVDVPRFEQTLQVHTTTYPHVAPESLRPVPADHNGRRKRVPGGSGLLASTRDPYSQQSPVKKRRLVEDDGSGGRAAPGKPGPKPKDKGVGIPRAKPKPNDPGSPTSIDFANGAYRAGNVGRNGSGRLSVANAILPKGTNGGSSNRVRITSRDEVAASRRAPNLDAIASRTLAGRGGFDDDDYASSAGPSAARRGSPHTVPEELHPNGDPNYQQNINTSNAHVNTTGHQPSARAAASRSRATVAAAAAEEYEFEVSGTYDVDETMGSVDDNANDEDTRGYCYCNRPSYGEMIGCDDKNCEREWFHFACLDLAKAPEGTWYCKECAEKRKRRPRAARPPAASAANNSGGAKKAKGRGGGGGVNGNGPGSGKAKKETTSKLSRDVPDGSDDESSPRNTAEDPQDVSPLQPAPAPRKESRDKDTIAAKKEAVEESITAELVIDPALRSPDPETPQVEEGEIVDTSMTDGTSAHLPHAADAVIQA